MTRYTKKFRAAISRPSKALEPVGSAAQDGWAHCYSLDIGHGSGAAKQTNICRERGFESWLALSPLERLDKSRLLPANISSCPLVQVDVVVVAASACVLAKEPYFSCATAKKRRLE